MNINDLTNDQLKALAYDTLVLLEQYKKNINIINGEIARRKKTMEEETTQVVEETTAEETTQEEVDVTPVTEEAEVAPEVAETEAVEETV